jgi:DNA-binding beta-propeller fold protein YncE
LREVARKFVGKTAKSVTLSADGRKLYVGVVGPVPLGEIKVFDAVTVSEVTTIESVVCPVDLFAASNAPLLFVATQCGGANDPLYIIDTRTDKVIRVIPGFAVGQSVVATPDGKTAFVSTGDSLSVVRNCLTEEPKIRRTSVSVTAMALSPDGRTLLVGTQVGNQGDIFSLNALNGERCTSIVPVGLEAPPPSIAIGPDGSLFAPMPTRLFVSDYRPFACS